MKRHPPPHVGRAWERGLGVQGKRLGEEEPVTADFSSQLRAKWPGSQETGKWSRKKSIKNIWGLPWWRSG